MLNNSNATISTTQFTSLNIIDPISTPVQTNGLFFLGNVTTQQRDAYKTDFLKFGALIYNITTNALEIYSLVDGAPAWTDVAAAGVVVNAPTLTVTPAVGAAIPLTNDMLAIPTLEGNNALYTSLTANTSTVSLTTATNNNTLLGRFIYFKNTEIPKNSTLCMITTAAPDGNNGDLNTLRIVPIAFR